MRIRPITDSIISKNVNFGAKMSFEVWEGFDFLGFEISQTYGKDSPEYDTFKKQMESIETLCPNEKIVIYTLKDEYKEKYYSFALKRFLRRPQIMTYYELCKDSLFNIENMKLLVSSLEDEEKALKKKKG